MNPVRNSIKNKMAEGVSFKISNGVKLLIITQKIDVNDDVLGFFHRWLVEFAKHCESIIVICLQKGEYDLPANVKVLSLGKEKGKSRLKYIFNFYKYIWQERKNYDAVFVHMNPEYVVLGGLLWKLWGKKISLWYTHKNVDLKLRLAEKMLDKIFTASKESFRLPSKKVEITGHGIDVNKFSAKGGSASGGKYKIITAGRIAPVKNYEILINTAEILRNKNFDFEIKIAGAPILESDKKYFEKIKDIAKKNNLEQNVKFIENVSYEKVDDFYRNGDLFINLSDTGSIDKAILEAMACGLLVLTSNEAFKKILPSKYLTSKDPKEIADKIIMLSKSERDISLREYVANNHNLDELINKITVSFSK